MSPPYVLIPTPELRKRVRLLATAGLSDDKIARAYILRPSELRERFGDELELGRADRKAPSPPKARKPLWSEPAGSRAAMAVQTAWLRAQVRAVPRSIAPATAREPRAGKTKKTELDRLEDWRKGDKEAVYDLSDQTLEDCLREDWASDAARETGPRDGAVDRSEPEDCRPAETTNKKANRNEGPYLSCPTRCTARRDVRRCGPRRSQGDGEVPGPVL